VPLLSVQDLGDEKTIYTIGIKFPGFWNINNVWDHVKISTSVDNTNWSLWYSYGEPTLQNPEEITDPLDFHIQSPLIISGTDRSVRYIKFELGYPAINSIHVGSGIEKVYAIGSESLYRNIDGLKWPKLEYDSNSSQFTLTEFSSDQIIFNTEGMMIEKKDRQGRTITYQYNGDKVSRIQYPEGVYMDFIYNAGGFISKVIDSSGRETSISTDSNGNIIEVIYPDGTKREYDYNNRGLMTMDKNGDAIKTYTWNANWPIMEKIILQNSGERIIDSWMNDFLLNDIESSE
jgi:YD repeat-containing protein